MHSFSNIVFIQVLSLKPFQCVVTYPIGKSRPIIFFRRNMTGTDLYSYKAILCLFAIIQMKIKVLTCFSNIELVTWSSILLLRARDVHENPVPDLNSFSSTFCSDDNFFILEDSKNSLSLVNYNVQSFFHNKYILQEELQHFDIVYHLLRPGLATPLTNHVFTLKTTQLHFCKDRGDDNHCGILVYVKSYIPAIRNLILRLLVLSVSVWSLKSKARVFFSVHSIDHLIFLPWFRLTLKTLLDLPMTLVLKAFSLLETLILDTLKAYTSVKVND